MRGNPRALAQRPLPSMMTATWRGTAEDSGTGAVTNAGGIRSDLRDVLLLGRDELVHLADEAVGELLDRLFGALVVVLGDELFLEQVLEMGVGVAPHVADRDLGVFALRAHVLTELFAALLGERRQRHADHTARGRRVQAQVRLADGLLDRGHHALVPGRHAERARIAHSDVGHLAERGLVAVVVDADALEQPRMRPSGADLAEIGLQGLDGFGHPRLRVFLYLFDILRHGQSPALTRVPSFSPSTIRSSAPGFRIENTRTGRFWSRQSAIEAMSMTPRRFSSTSP